MTKFLTKRIYDGAESGDGYRVLVDRLWPRGVSKESAKLDQWARELAPSDTLRKWFGHDPDKYEQFAKKYIDELKSNGELESYIDEWKKHEVVTLLYGAKDEKCNQATVLRDYLK